MVTRALAHQLGAFETTNQQSWKCEDIFVSSSGHGTEHVLFLEVPVPYRALQRKRIHNGSEGPKTASGAGKLK